MRRALAAVAAATVATTLTAATADAAGTYVQTARIATTSDGYHIVVVTPTSAWRNGGPSVDRAAYTELAALIPGIRDRRNLYDQAVCHRQWAPQQAAWNLEADRRTVSWWGMVLSGCNPARVGKLTRQQLVTGVELPGAY